MDITTNILPFTEHDFPGEGARTTKVADTIGARGQVPPAATGATQGVTTPTSSLPASILESWSKIAQANMTVSMYRKLVRVAALPDGWRGPGSRSLQAKSLASFLEFWAAVQNGAAEPELALAPDGSLHAEWFRAPRQRLDVRFADQKLFFGLFANNRIIEGADQLNEVARILTQHDAKPLSWSAK